MSAKMYVNYVNKNGLLNINVRVNGKHFSSFYNVSFYDIENFESNPTSDMKWLQMYDENHNIIFCMVCDKIIDYQSNKEITLEITKI